MLEHLITAGFIQKQSLWSFKTTKKSKQSLYRICDPYMLCHLKLLESTADFENHMGLQIEQLLLQNRPLLLKSMGIEPHDVIADGPYRQSKTSSRKGCQIDYLVQTATKNIFVCEFKFKLQELNMEVMTQVHDKIKALKIPRGFAAIPVLFHIGGVSSGLATESDFYRIIDISDFLQSDE